MAIKKSSRRPKKLKGFTLLEMIVVMAIIGVLASIIVPNTVSQMRQARIEQANSNAKQVYQAVQDYCTRMQIKKVPLTAAAGEPAAFPYTTPTGTDKKILVQFVGAKSDAYSSVTKVTPISSDNLNGSTNPEVTWGFVKVTAVGTGAEVVDLTTGEERGRRALTGITNNLGSSMSATQVGSFIAQIDVETYTVDLVAYSDEPSALTDVQSVFDKSNGGKYTQIFGHSATGRSQEDDTNKGTYKYIGQYPI